MSTCGSATACGSTVGPAASAGASVGDSSAGASTGGGVVLRRRVRVTLTGGTTSSEAASTPAAATGSSTALAGVALRRRRVFGAASSSPAIGANTSACGDSPLPVAAVDASTGASVCSGWFSGAALRRLARLRAGGFASAVLSVLLLAVASAGSAPVRSPPSGSFSSMDVLQFWLPRARVSAATQGRRKRCFRRARRCATAEVCLPER
ncbi:hypothetical protein B0E53_06775 [Micromonospora sp. MH33]|nr:hypothetical protein B0E53_06775 [Micromonospora sp. MH33]